MDVEFNREQIKVYQTLYVKKILIVSYQIVILDFMIMIIIYIYDYYSEVYPLNE